MAIFHFHAKTSSNKTTAMAHLNYINREDIYKNRKDLIHKEVENLPKEFDSAKDFWQTAIEEERKKATLFREYEITLPIEFSDNKNKEIAKDYLKKEFGKDYVYNYAFHNPEGLNPHIHVMVCERKLDNIERPKEQFFKTYKPKNPEKGGAKKDRELQQKTKLHEMRTNWAKHVNEYLKEKGFEEITEKSLKQQKKDKLIEKGKKVKPKHLSKRQIAKKKLHEVKNDLIEIQKNIREKKIEIDQTYRKIKNSKEYAINKFSNFKLKKIKDKYRALKIQESKFVKEENLNELEKLKPKIIKLEKEKEAILEKYSNDPKVIKMEHSMKDNYKKQLDELYKERSQLNKKQKLIVRNVEDKKGLLKVLRVNNNHRELSKITIDELKYQNNGKRKINKKDLGRIEKYKSKKLSLKSLKGKVDNKLKTILREKERSRGGGFTTDIKRVKREKEIEYDNGMDI